MRVLQNFVRQMSGKWTDAQWAVLVERIRLMGYEGIREERIRRLVEDNLERWLAGENDVGPPPGGPREAVATGGPAAGPSAAIARPSARISLAPASGSLGHAPPATRPPASSPREVEVATVSTPAPAPPSPAETEPEQTVPVAEFLAFIDQSDIGTEQLRDASDLRAGDEQAISVSTADFLRQLDDVPAPSLFGDKEMDEAARLAEIWHETEPVRREVAAAPAAPEPAREELRPAMAPPSAFAPAIETASAAMPEDKQAVATADEPPIGKPRRRVARRKAAGKKAKKAGRKAAKPKAARKRPAKTTSAKRETKRPARKAAKKKAARKKAR